MINLSLSYSDFIYPWTRASLAERLSFLCNLNKKNIVYIYEVADYSTFRYRAYNMCEILKESENISATYIFSDEIEVFLKYIDRVDSIVFVRVRYSLTLDFLFSHVIAKNISTYFDVDDLIYDLSALPLVLNSINSRNEDAWYSYAARIFATAKNCDRYITTNDFLAKKMRVFFEKKVSVVKNFINFDQMKLSDYLFALKKFSIKNKDIFLIGYFSGTNSHYHDFKSISAELSELMRQDRRVHLRIVGYLDLPKNLQFFLESGRIECIPLQNYLDLQVKIAECDLNLIPLLLNAFSHCKSEIKYFEASAVGTESIATPTFIYEKIIQDGENGYLTNQGGWKEKIENILHRAEGEKDTTEAARAYVKDNFFGEVILRDIERIFFD
jgi:glycosyltransferase involved in cell wall biosynthesis